MSKYGTGLAVLDDDLPDLKWHRLITRLPAEKGTAPFSAARTPLTA